MTQLYTTPAPYATYPTTAYAPAAPAASAYAAPASPWSLDLGFTGSAAPVVTTYTLNGYAPAVYGASASLQAALQQLYAMAMSLLSGYAPAPAPAPAPQPGTPPPPPGGRKATKLTVSSFNILGSNHTQPGGDAKGYASGVTRIRWAADMLRQKNVDVVGFQEMQQDQAREFVKAAGDTYGIFPGPGPHKMGARNSIAWRKDEWEMVKGYTVDMYSHKGNLWPSPVLRLRNKETGQEAYFLNFHNAPGARKDNAQQVWRDKATNQQVALINKLKQSGLPVIVTGDMNERENYHRRMTVEAGMDAANELPDGRLPKKVGIDWIFGSQGISFKGFLRQRNPKVSDHAMIVSQAKIEGSR